MLTTQELSDLRKKYTSTNEDGTETFDTNGFDTELLQLSQTKEGQIRSAERKAEREKLANNASENQSLNNGNTDKDQDIAGIIAQSMAPLVEELNNIKTSQAEKEKQEKDNGLITSFSVKAKAENVQDSIIQTLIATSLPEKLESIDLSTLPKNEQGFAKGAKEKNNNNGGEIKSPKGYGTPFVAE